MRGGSLLQGCSNCRGFRIRGGGTLLQGCSNCKGFPQTLYYASIEHQACAVFFDGGIYQEYIIKKAREY